MGNILFSGSICSIFTVPEFLFRMLVQPVRLVAFVADNYNKDQSPSKDQREFHNDQIPFLLYILVAIKKTSDNLEVSPMMNFNNPKTKKTFAAVIALILVASMVLSVFLSAFV